MDTSDLTQMSFDLRRRDYDRERRLLLLGQLEERLASGPGVQAALASAAPLDEALTRRLQIEGQAVATPDTLPLVSMLRVGQRYFDVVGAPVIAGRALAADDVRQPDDNVVINERFARMHFPDGAAVGKRILLIEPNAS